MIFSASKSVSQYTMKQGKSPLNPYAASCIPLSRERTDNENGEIEYATAKYKQAMEDVEKDNCKDSRRSDENPQRQLPNTDALKRNSSGIEGSHDFGNSLENFEDSMPHRIKAETEEKNPFEVYELDLAYLAAAFPYTTEQSLLAVYCTNDGDREASVDMLIELEDSEKSGTVDDDDLRAQKTTTNGEAIRDTGLD